MESHLYDYFPFNINALTIRRLMPNQIKHKCFLCDEEYHTQDADYARRHPQASAQDRDDKWWEHYTRECKEFDNPV